MQKTGAESLMNQVCKQRIMPNAVKSLFQDQTCKQIGIFHSTLSHIGVKRAKKRHKHMIDTTRSAETHVIPSLAFFMIANDARVDYLFYVFRP